MKNNSLGNNIKLYRTEHGWKQEEFGERLSDYVGRSKKFTIAAVSAWETGRKKPSLEVITAISELFGISVSQLMGQSQTLEAEDLAIDAMPTAPLGLIAFKQLAEFHERPVYLSFSDYQRKDQWGLVDFKNKAIILTTGDKISIEKNNKSLKIYAMQSAYSRDMPHRAEKCLTIDQILRLNRVWVEMTGYDDFVRGVYNGWMYHNKTHTCLINARGDVLPYDGLGIAYNAYARIEHE